MRRSFDQRTYQMRPGVSSGNAQMPRNLRNGLCDHYQLAGQCPYAGVGIGESYSNPFLPSNACSTLIVEGLPTNYFFRRLDGFKGVKLWTAESSLLGGGLVTPCVVYFETPEHAAAAMRKLQGSTFDIRDGKVFRLNLQFFCAAARLEGTSGGSS